MSGDHNQHQKDKSYLDRMDRYKQVRELVKDPSLRIKDIVELTGYDKGHVSRLRKASQQFECPRCGHCCQGYELGFVDGMQHQMKSSVDRAINKQPTKILGPNLEEVLNSAGFYKKREWQRLTDEEIEDEWEKVTGHSIFGGDRKEGRTMYISPDEVVEFAKTIEAKLRVKNHG